MPKKDERKTGKLQTAVKNVNKVAMMAELASKIKKWGFEFLKYLYNNLNFEFNFNFYLFLILKLFFSNYNKFND